MPIGLHMRCIIFLLNVLYRFEIFFLTSENCFGKLMRSSNLKKKCRGCGGSSSVGSLRATSNRSSRMFVDLPARPYIDSIRNISHTSQYKASQECL